MKKKIFPIFLALIVVLGIAAGCGGGSEETSTPAVTLISGFNEMKELRSFKYTDYFYRAEITDDSRYVTEGDRAAKLTIDGGDGGIPEFSVFTNTQWCGIKDFTMVQALSVDIYNADEKDHTVKISFTTRNGAVDRTSYTGKTYTLKPGANDVVFEFDRSMAAFVCYIDKVEYITFTFDNSHNAPYVLYMDNLKAHMTEKTAEPFVKEYKEGELLFFDDKVDRGFVKATTIRAVPGEAGEISLNRNKKYIYSGDGSLKCTVAVNPSTNPNNAPAITVSGQPLQRLDFSQYSKVQFKVMCDATLPGNMNFSVEFYDVNDVLLNSIDHIRNYIPWGEPLQSDTWFTLEVKTSDLAAAGLDLTKIDRINFYYGTPASGEPYSWYVDDITLVK